MPHSKLEDRHQFNAYLVIFLDIRQPSSAAELAEDVFHGRIEEMVKQIRSEIVINNKQTLLFTHCSVNASSSIGELSAAAQSIHLDSWLPIAMVKNRLHSEMLVDFDIILETDEAIDPHSLDVLMNVCGVKLVCPTVVEHHLTLISPSLLDNRGAKHIPSELWRNYTNGMLVALKRIMAKDGDVDLSTRINSRTYSCIFLASSLARAIGISSYLSSSNLSLTYILSTFNDRFLHSTTIILPRGALMKSARTSPHLWDSKRVSSLQTLLSTKTSDNFDQYFNMNGKWNIRKHFTAKQLVRSVAIIGAGPAGLETAIQLSADANIQEIVVFESYFLPGGKIIDSVAPDHPITKKQLRNFSLFEHEKIKFVGNAYINDEKLKEIYDRFSAVFLTHGAVPRKLAETIPGAAKVLQADDIVRWYNSKTSSSSASSTNPPVNVTQTKSIAIIGAGNVTLDIARMFLRDPSDETLRDNVKDHVLEQLTASTINEVTCIARRSILDVKYGVPELSELQDLAENDSMFDIIADFDLRKTEEKAKQLPETDERTKIFTFFKHFHHSQPKSKPSNKQSLNKRKLLRFTFNEDIDENIGFTTGNDSRITAHFVSGRTLTADTFIASLGYIPHMPVSNVLNVLDSGQAAINTEENGCRKSAVVPNILVVGQAKTGHTKSDVKTVLKQLDSSILREKPQVGEYLDSEFYSKGAVSKEVAQQLMTIHESTKSYITFGTVQQLVESARKLFIASKKVNNMDKNNASSSSVTTVEQVKVVDKNPRKLHIIEETPVSTESASSGRLQEIELPCSNRSLRECLSINKGDCESGSCGGCYLLSSESVSNYDSAETKIAISKGGLSRGSIPDSYTAILSCQHSSKDLPSDKITKLILQGAARSACGIGVHVSQHPSKEFVQCSVQHLIRDSARGAGANGYGDGAGLLLRIDWDFFFAHCDFPQRFIDLHRNNQLNSNLAICSVFLKDDAAKDIQQISSNLTRLGLSVVLQRLVPLDASKFSLKEAREHPQPCQFFITASDNSPESLKNAITKIQQNPLSIVNETDALSSISTNYVCYKLAGFAFEIAAYTDLQPTSSYVSSMILSHARFATTTLQPTFIRSAAVKAHPFQNLIHNGEIVTKRAIITYLHTHSKLFRQKNILVDADELAACSDSYVLQRYIQCLAAIFPEFTLADIFHLVTRSTTHVHSKLAEFARATGLPQVCGPSCIAMFDEKTNQLIFYRDNNGFRPAVLVQQEEQSQSQSVHILSQQHEQNRHDQVHLVAEGQIYVISQEDCQVRSYTPNDKLVQDKFVVLSI